MLKDFLVDLSEYEEKKKRIGTGKYGKVFLIRKKSQEELYVAKIFQGRLIGEKSFMNEIETYYKIKHQAILPFVGYSLKDFDSKPNPAIITEYMCNGSLRDIFSQMRQSPKEWSDTKRYIALIGIALGMNYLHANKIVHRDLKPENILFDCDYYPKICDFGISKKSDEDINDFFMKTAIGTEYYRAPETYRGCEYNFKADIYSFSIVLYEIIVCPFKSSQKVDMADIKGKENKEFIKKCHSNKPSERPDFSEICQFIVSKSFMELFEGIELDEVVTFLELFEGDETAEMMKQILLSQKISEDQTPLKKPMLTDEITVIDSKSYSDHGYIIEINNFQDFINHKETARFVEIPFLFNYVCMLFCSSGAKKSDNLPCDRDEAVRYLKMAADKGEASAMYSYAKMLFSGDGVKMNKAEAARYFRMSAEKGNSSAMYSYAKMLFSGDGVKMNKAEAARYFRMSAERGNDRAMNKYGAMLRRGDGVRQDKKEAVKYFLKSIDLGNRTAMNSYAVMLRDGDGIAENKQLAAKYFRMSIEHGGDYAMYNLGQMLKDGDGIQKDKGEAFYLFKASADKGNTFAMNSYAVMLRDGDCGVSDKLKAACYFKLAADKGNDFSMYNYARMLKDGDGIQMDKSEAFRYFKMAAVRGSDRAMNSCAEMLRDGDGVHVNKKEAASLFKMAADKGNDRAMVNYANMLLKGDGVEFDKQEAVHYFGMAAMKGNRFAIDKLVRL
ncbi:hypothetical protein M9Y10_004073 [Tritrichomonas musculus]|uniref:Protein kinase domain-containing protein n=1 Tax=Tritrichomonas musculus TaxID=1915356 RepID=A0ABR2JRU3_9EUKA